MRDDSQNCMFCLCLSATQPFINHTDILAFVAIETDSNQAADYQSHIMLCTDWVQVFNTHTHTQQEAQYLQHKLIYFMTFFSRPNDK